MVRITVVVDSRIRLRLSELGEELAAEIRAEFAHKNPQREMLKRIGKPYWQEPKTIDTWREERGELTLPRGGMPRVRAALERHRRAREVVDLRVPGVVQEDFPEHKVVLHSFQQETVRKALAAESGIIRAPTGCLTGDTLVTVNRAGKGGKMRLDHVVHMFNKGKSSGKCWNPDIPTMVRAPFSDGRVRLALVLDARYSGTKDVYEARFGQFHKLRMTSDHRVMTPFGWRRLDQLAFGDAVLVDAGMGKGGKSGPRLWYKLRTLKEHPFAGRRGVNPGKGGWTVPVHRLVAEARENGMALEEFVERVRAGESLQFLDPKVWVVHHKDEDPHNNVPENLEVMTHEEHRHVHRPTALENIASRLVVKELVEVTFVGEEETYDLEVERAEAFIANGVAVHNSGKTTAAFGLMARARVPCLVGVGNQGLLKQWVKRAQRELGLGEREVGVVQGAVRRLRPVTIAMLQTLRSRGVDPEMAAYFGMVIVDEVHGAAAPTMYAAVDPFPARYRIGISADHRRKDRREFMVEDLFGGLLDDIARKTLIKSGHVLEVQIRVIPTDHEAPWFGMPTDERPELEVDTVRLHQELADDYDRNELALSIVAREALDGGEQVLVFSHLREHCMVLDQRLVSLGINTGFLIGGDDYRVAHDRTLAGIESGEVRVAVGTYGAVGQAIDLPSVAVGVCTSPIASNKQVFNQVRGRFCRTSVGKKGARLYYLWDRHVYGEKHLRNICAWNADVVVLDGENWVRGREYLSKLAADLATVERPA